MCTHFLQFKKEDRDKLEILHKAGHKAREIAALLGFHISSIYRELKQ